MPKKLTKLQKKHFGAMDENGLKFVILDAEKQMSVISMSDSVAADMKRAELQLRIEYCENLLRKKRT